MNAFIPRNAEFKTRVEASFARQPFVGYLGGSLAFVAPGAVDIALAFKPDLTQQYGYVHGGVVTSIADAAAAYAAMTLASAEVGVLTTELKVNFLRPAGQGRMVAKGRVLKPGRTLTVCQADVIEERGAQHVHVLTGLVTIMCIEKPETKDLEGHGFSAT
jgi:uncharacterized protein (TIGR00369 family)